jgi:hypothetical protein
MAGSLKKVLKEEYNRIRRALEKMIKPGQDKEPPKWALQPIRPRKY